MKNRILSLTLMLASIIHVWDVNARNPNSSTFVHQASYKTETSSCSIPISQVSLDINNVRTTLLNGGDLWYDPHAASGSYEVPKGSSGSSTGAAQAIYAGAIWISGLDVGGNLRIAAETYRTSGGVDFYTGPLDNNGNVTLATCNLWDRHFPVWASQIRPLISAYVNAVSAGGTPGNITLPLAGISDSVKYWPGKGNPYLAAQGYDVSGVLAPFYDADGDGVYDPAHGDYPSIMQSGLNPSASSSYCGHSTDSISYIHNTAYADQMIYWVMNDIGNVHHGSTDGVAIGVQINALAFAFQTNDAINDMTFYRYQVINKSGNVLNKTYISQYTDPDLGCPDNDQIGCDTTRNMAFVYNGVPPNTPNTYGYNYVCDLTGGNSCNQGTIGYGCDLPVLEVIMMETPSDTTTYADPNNSAVRIHHQRGMTAFGGFTQSTSASTTGQYYRNYQMAIENGVHLEFNNHDINYEFPGDPSVATEWSGCYSQVGPQIFAADRRMLQSSGPFTFMPCASQYMTIGVTFVRPVNTNCPSMSAIAPATDSAQSFFNRGFRLADHYYTAVSDLNPNKIGIYPNPVSSKLTFDTKGDQQIDNVMVYDLTGRLVMTQSDDVRSVDMTQLPDGIYLVKAHSGDIETTLKVVKR